MINRRGGFLDKVKAKMEALTLPKKLVALLGTGALFLTGIGLGLNSCGNNRTENPKPQTSVTQEAPDPVDSITPTPASPADYPPIDATEPPHPEMELSREYKGLGQLVERLKEATSQNEKRAAITDWANQNIEEKIDADENGIVHTTKKNEAQTIRDMGRHEVAKLGLFSDLNRDYYMNMNKNLLSAEDHQTVMGAYLDTSTVGQAREKIETLFEQAKYPDDIEHNQYRLTGTLVEATGKDGTSAYLRTNIFNESQSSSTGDLARWHHDTSPRGINWSGMFAVYQVISKSTQGTLPYKPLLETTVAFKYGGGNYDPDSFNRPNEEQLLESHETGENVFLTAEILSSRLVGENSEIPFMVNGENKPAGELPQVREFTKDWPDSD